MRKSSWGYLQLGRRRIHWVNMGHISDRKAQVYAVAAWANDCERKLLSLHVGQMLDRGRHRAWAEEMVSRYFTRPRANLPLYVEQLWRDEPLRPNLDVPDHTATDTGLLNHRGDTIMRGPNPIGFQAKL